MAFHPYLNFGGNCREAFTRYQQIFGGELMLLTEADMPSEGAASDQASDLIIHAALTFEGHLLMASDVQGFEPAGGMYVDYSITDIAETKRVFEALADGGQVEVALAPTPWSPSFGVCVDRFGTPWMVDAEAPVAPS